MATTRREFAADLNRRSVLQAGFSSLLGISLPGLLQLQAASGTKGRRTALIFVELAGGPTQFETYDPKPDAPSEFRGEFEPVATSIPGIQFSEWMPEQAKIAEKLSVIRSIHHGHNSHDPSSHLSQTGYYKSGPKGGPNQSPCIGSVIARVRGPNTPSLPAYVAVPDTMRNGRAAYLGQSCNPFEAGGDPNSDMFEVPNLQLTKNVSIDRLHDRRSLLTTLDARRELRDLEGATRAVDDFSQQAFDLVYGSRAREAFDISREPDKTRDRYGRNTVGQSMLLARRLVEAGVTCVTVRSTGWDDHNKIAEGLAKHAPPYDLGVATLVQDLAERGLQDDVLVVAMGEFGRTPRVNSNAGRDHWGSVMSVMLAG
ncbi:MAG: DUF1501 domain-containing protein, partial [Pirellulaceae bacterium]|nr:DUF1501 domain-containing protein [Pirellulaceae bacterium]